MIKPAVILDASCLAINPHSGLSRVVHNLAQRLRDVASDIDVSIFVNYFRFQHIHRVQYDNIKTLYSRLPRRIAKVWWRLGWPPLELTLRDGALFHSLHIDVPPTRKMKTVLTVHDCRYLALPNLYSNREIRQYRQQMKLSLARVDRVVTVSEFTRQEVRKHFNFPLDRIATIQNGFSADRFNGAPLNTADLKALDKLRLPKTYLLYLGVLDPRKNLGRLIEAYNHCLHRSTDFPPLVLSGIDNYSWAKSRLSRKVSALGLTDRICLTGMVSEPVLHHILNGASVLCYPSLYEGFGFPPLESMACGVPVLAGAGGAIPEVLGDAAFLVDPKSVEHIAAGLYTMVYDNECRRRLIRHGYSKIKEFSWRRAAEDYVRIYMEALAS